MKVQKEYGIFNLMEFVLSVIIGGRYKDILFEGGLTTAYGVTPARYTTSNAIVQHAIENTREYKTGRIRLLGVNPTTPLVYERKHNHSEQPTKAEDRSDTTPDNGGATPDDEGATPDDNSQSGEVAQEPEEQRVEVTCVEDAIEYLKEHFGLKNLRGRNSMEKAAKDRGIVFVITDNAVQK